MTGDRVRLAVLGHPLRYTRSPDLHRAGMAAVGRDCESEALPTSPAELPDRLRRLSADGFRGCNLTHPLKQAAVALAGRVSAVAARARSVNTIGFEGPDTWGDTTDGPGFLDWLHALGKDPARERVVLLGAGGASRSLAAALLDAGAPAPVVSARRPQACAPAWADLAAVSLVPWRSPEEAAGLARATLVVHATPLEDPREILDPGSLPAGAAVMDLRYAPQVTPWVAAARRLGFEAWDGLGLLVHQARRSLSLWAGCEVPLAPLERAVGWPR